MKRLLVLVHFAILLLGCSSAEQQAVRPTFAPKSHIGPDGLERIGVDFD